MYPINYNQCRAILRFERWFMRSMHDMPASWQTARELSPCPLPFRPYSVSFHSDKLGVAGIMTRKESNDNHGTGSYQLGSLILAIYVVPRALGYE